MSSASSMGYLAPSGIDSDHDPEQPLPLQAQQSQSWIQTSFQAIAKALGLSEPMPSDLRAELAKADELRDKSWKWTRAGRMKEAYKTYMKVAPEFISANQLVDAAYAFEQAALLKKREKLGDDFDNIDTRDLFDKAADNYRTARPADSARCTEEVIQSYIKEGNTRTPAPKQDTLGDLYMNSLGDTDKAIEAWEKAASWYRNSAKSTMTVLAIYRKLGEAYIIKKGDYRRAMELYEWCANNYPHSGGELSRGYSIAPYYLKAGLCHFAINDTVATSRALHTYFNTEPDFANQKEGKFLMQLGRAQEAGDDVGFGLALKSYDKFNPMPKWQYQMADRALEAMTNQEEDFA